MCEFVVKWFEKMCKNRDETEQLRKASQEEIDKEADWRTSGCNFTAKKVYSRPTYSIDKLGVIEAREKRLEEPCNKNFSSFPGLTGGVFVPRCALHGFSIGWSSQPYKEKYSDAFSFFLTRNFFPKTIICDYVCIFLSYSQVLLITF